MKQPSLLILMLALLPAFAHPQAMPDAPSPAPTAQPGPPPTQPAAPLPDPAWLRIQHIARGEEIVVSNTYGPDLHCRYAGATDQFLFCDAIDLPPGAGEYRFERASVLHVRIVRPRPDWHPGIVAAMVIAGVVAGAGETQHTDAKSAAGIGLCVAGVVGGIALSIVETNRTMDQLIFGSQYAGNSRDLSTLREPRALPHPRRIPLLIHFR